MMGQHRRYSRGASNTRQLSLTIKLYCNRTTQMLFRRRVLAALWLSAVVASWLDQPSSPAFSASFAKKPRPASLVGNRTTDTLEGACMDALRGRREFIARPTDGLFPVRLHAYFASCFELLAEGVYVYDREIEAAGINLFPCTGSLRESRVFSAEQPAMFSSQLHAVQVLLNPRNGYLTRDKARARLFFVPQYATVEYLQDYNPKCLRKVEDGLLRILTVINSTAEWRRCGGCDHIFVFPYDTGIRMFPFFAREIPSSVILWQAENHRNAWSRGVCIPIPTLQSWSNQETYDTVLKQGVTSSKGFAQLPWSRSCLSQFPYLGVFRGSFHFDKPYNNGLLGNVVRRDLFSLYNASTEVIVGFSNSSLFFKELRMAAFGLSPPGWAAWTQRTYDLIALAKPVVFFDSVLGSHPKPFAQFIRWDDFSITVPLGSVHTTHVILRNSSSRACDMREALQVLRPFLLWRQHPLDVMQLALLDSIRLAFNL